MKAFLCFICIAALTCPLGLLADGRSVSERYLAAAASADLSGAARLFESLSPDDQVGAAMYRHFQQRFLQDSRPGNLPSDQTASRIIETYQHYWRKSLLGEWPSTEGIRWLETSLRQLFHPEQPAHPQARSQSYLLQQGLFANSGQDRPLSDLRVWRNQSVTRYEIDLTDGTHPVDVVFMQDFLSRGWLHYASFGSLSNSGWATEEALYCIREAWDTDSERFRVSFLKHEARHLVDFRKYPGLDLVQLEYRAKLTELAYAWSSVWRLLEGFSRYANPESDDPHGAANALVLEAVHVAMFGEPAPESFSDWRFVSVDAVNKVARELLKVDDERLISGITGP